MRFQVRVGEQYQELMEHLETFKPEYRGKRLIALAAMQLSSLCSNQEPRRYKDNLTAEAQVSTEEQESEIAPASQTKKPASKSAPQWIKQNANA